MKIISVILYIGSILLANLFVKWFGLISIGWLVFPAGAILIGLCFTFRDMVQYHYGKYKCWLWMIVATLITISFSKEIAFASGLAFLAAEFVDWLIFTLTKKPFKQRIILSNIISLPLDSLIFVPIVFGLVWPAIIGQAIVKIVFSLMILPFVKNKKSPVVYLAGPINNCNDSECNDWRNYFIRTLPNKCYNPMDRDYRGKEVDSINDIVELDKKDIDNSDIIIVKYEKPSVGTSMEIFYAWSKKKLIFIWNCSNTNLSPWLVYHSNNVFETKEELINEILSRNSSAKLGK